jgi:hypothetical protein
MLRIALSGSKNVVNSRRDGNVDLVASLFEGRPRIEIERHPSIPFILDGFFSARWIRDSSGCDSEADEVVPAASSDDIPEEAAQLPPEVGFFYEHWAVLSSSEIKAMLDAELNTKHRLLLMMVYASGLRVSEVVALKRQDIDCSRKAVLVVAGKTAIFLRRSCVPLKHTMPIPSITPGFFPAPT